MRFRPHPFMFTVYKTCNKNKDRCHERARLRSKLRQDRKEDDTMEQERQRGLEQRVER